MATGTITSTGLGSGLDIESIVTSLVAAETAPEEARIERNERETSTLISALGQLNNAVANIKSAALTLASLSTFSSFTVTSDQKSSVSASVTEGASEASYEIEVNSIAVRQSIASDTFATADAIVGSGTLTVAIGTPTYTGSKYSGFSVESSIDIAIGTSSTLEQVRDAINEQEAGVEASLVKDGSEYRLLLVSEKTGVENSIQLSVSGDADGSDVDLGGLSRLAFDTNTANLTQTNAASDANFSINGLVLTSSSNEIENALDGVSLTLLAKTSTPARVGVALDVDRISEAVGGLISKYNEYVETNNGLSTYNPTTRFAGPLTGDFSSRNIASSIRGALGSVVEGGSDFYNSLAAIGVTTKSDGTLEFNRSKFNTVLSEDRAAVVVLFAGDESRSIEGIAERLNKALDAVVGSDGLLKSRTDSLSARRDAYEEQKIELERRAELLEVRYRAQFNALDALIARLNTSGDFLQTQLELLPLASKSD